MRLRRAVLAPMILLLALLCACGGGNADNDLVLSLREPEKPVLRAYRVWGGRADAEELVIEP